MSTSLGQRSSAIGRRHQDDSHIRSTTRDPRSAIRDPGAGFRLPVSVGHAAGQVAVEWLMVAGILTAVAILLTAMFKPVLIDMVRLLARSVRMVGL